MFAYSSFGKTTDGTGIPFKYTGRYFDAETGLYYYRARYYSPIIGRFLQTDTIGYADGLNWYAYVGNDPVNMTDPSGNEGYFAARTLNNLLLKNWGHSFNADYANKPGDPKAMIYSFGRMDDGTAGLIGYGVADTDEYDVFFAEDGPDVLAQDKKMWGELAPLRFKKLGTEDGVVSEVAKNAPKGIEYCATGGDNCANSNSFAVSGSNEAARRSGSSVRIDHRSFSVELPGGGITVTFDEETGKATATEDRARTGTRIRRSSTSCVDKSKC